MMQSDSVGFIIVSKFFVKYPHNAYSQILSDPRTSLIVRNFSIVNDKVFKSEYFEQEKTPRE
jgi:hypothetical protein